MKYNHKNLVNNALILGSRDYMKTGFLKGPAPLNPNLYWRTLDATYAIAVDSDGKIAVGDNGKVFRKTFTGPVYSERNASSYTTQIAEWGETPMTFVESQVYDFRGTIYTIYEDSTYPAIEDYQP